MTQDEIKQIERIFQKPINEVDELDVPAFIRKRDAMDWAEEHGACQDENGEWIV
jgi:hypothetical protein